MILQPNFKDIQEIKEAVMKANKCLVSYKTFNHGWTTRVCNFKDIDNEKVLDDINDFSHMVFGETELASVQNAYAEVLQDLVISLHVERKEG